MMTKKDKNTKIEPIVRFYTFDRDANIDMPNYTLGDHVLLGTIDTPLVVSYLERDSLQMMTKMMSKNEPIVQFFPRGDVDIWIAPGLILSQFTVSRDAIYGIGWNRYPHPGHFSDTIHQFMIPNDDHE